ncbi:transmembrane protein 154 isoform X1 [Coregonus clupeaformis]|uniref:transmembrane protein 154 isoform X1 n=1 Tax=Coregonus clupeaformis TaxID=59861 RepID=UPI001E1C7B04|nr:transmembrane protein 154 isoform X1 [Coregonus clupeaformis]
MSAAVPVHGNARTRGRRGYREMTPPSFLLLLALTACLAGTVFCQDDEDTNTVEDPETENDAVIPTVSDATPTPEPYVSTESPSEGYETKAETGSGDSPGVNVQDMLVLHQFPNMMVPLPDEDNLKSSEAPLEESLSHTFILVPVVLVVIIIAMVVGIIIINRRWNQKEKSNSDNVEEDKYLHGSDDTEKVPMPMFEDDVPSVLEMEMEDLEQWMTKDGGVRMDSGQRI